MATVSKVLDKKGSEVIAVSPDTVIPDAISKMADRSAGTVLVMDGDKLVGILSERDFIRKVYLQNKCGQDVKVREIMSADLMTVTADDSLEHCMQIMTDKRIRHLPVMDDGRVAGVVSIGDIVKFIVSEQDSLIKNLESYISGPGL